MTEHVLVGHGPRVERPQIVKGGRTLALDLDDEDDLEEQQWHQQHPMHEAACVVEGNARELWVRLPLLVLVGTGSSSRPLAARPTNGRG